MIVENSEGVEATRFGVYVGGVVSGHVTSVDGGGGGGVGDVEVGVEVVEAGDCTAAVCAETATVDPPEFEAVTDARRVAPTSAVVRGYVKLVEPAIGAQL